MTGEKPLRGIEEAEIGAPITLRVQARNNYSLVGEQDITTWETRTITLVTVAVGLDEALAEGVRRRGCSGSGAGARLLITVVDEAGQETEIEIEDLNDALVADLPFGSVKRLYRYAAVARERRVWDGHNHVAVAAPAVDGLIERYRAHRARSRNT